MKELLYSVFLILFPLQSLSSLSAVYHVGPDGWKKVTGDDVGDLHFQYYPVVPATVEQEMVEVVGA